MKQKDFFISKYPLKTWLHEKFKTIGSPQTGLLKAAVIANLDMLMPKIFSFGGDMAEFHRLLGFEEEIQYHIGGYGIFYEEAFVRVMSEALERYCLMFYPHFIQDEIVYASYAELKSSGENIVPFRYFQLFSEHDYKKHRFPFHPPSKEDICGWLPTPSLFSPNKEIYVPAQLLVPGYRINKKKGEKRWAPGFSTGSASHITVQNALLNALMEYIEIDAYMIHWFTKRPAPRIDYQGSVLEEIITEIMDTNILEPILLYHTLPDLPIPTISSFIVNKKGMLPAVTAGSQTDLDPLHCAYRSLMEATAVTLLGMGGYIYQPLLFFGEKDYTKITDLDSNVSFYAEPNNQAVSLSLIKEITDPNRTIHIDDLPQVTSRKPDDQLQFTLKQLNKVSQYAVTTEITTPDIAELGFRVVKVFIPELNYMTLPSYPYTNHPRILSYGGVQNQYPHPLP